MKTDKIGAWLARLSDPQGLNLNWPCEPFSQSDADFPETLMDAAGLHNVRPSLVRNLGVQLKTAPDEFLSGDAAWKGSVSERLISQGNELRLIDIARAMQLASVAEGLLDRIAVGGIPAALVKGVDFAENAYGGLHARTFSDIDLLVRPDAETALNEILKDAGFTLTEPAGKRLDYAERQWTRPNEYGGITLVEVHTDMVHAPELRLRQSLTYDLYADPAAGGISPAARLVLAGLHGATSHLFGRLQYVVDGLAVARMAVDPVELRDRARRSGATLAVATTLRLATDIFGCQTSRELLEGAWLHSVEQTGATTDHCSDGALRQEQTPLAAAAAAISLSPTAAMGGPATVKRYRALFMAAAQPEPAAAMRGWLSAGHEIAAIWIPSNFSPGMLRRDARLARLAPQWSMAAVAREHNITVLEVPRLAGWSEATDRARAVGADVLVSAYFQFLIPMDVLGLFEGRAVNLHPAPLPRYRGPQPLQAMILDGSIVSDACVTLHVLAGGFDTGDIIGVCPVAFPDDRSPTRFSLAIARACAHLAATALPAYLDGERSSYPQDEALAGYCRFERDALAIGPHLDAETVRLICDLSGLCSISGMNGVRVSGFVRTTGPALGQPPSLGFWHIEMDLADFRVRLKRKRTWTRPVRNAKRLAIQLMERDASC